MGASTKPKQTLRRGWHLGKKLELRILLQKNRPGHEKDVLSIDQIQWLVDFLDLPKMAYTTLGRKDTVYVSKIGDQKQYEPQCCKDKKTNDDV